MNDKLNVHSLRHTFASWLVQEGVSLYKVQRLLGHQDIDAQPGFLVSRCHSYEFVLQPGRARKLAPSLRTRNSPVCFWI